MKKIVCESLNEVISFERGKDPLSALNIGKTQLIKNWLEKYEIKNYSINDDLTIDANNFFLHYFFDKNLKNFPEYIQFNEISGDFVCQRNKLTSLRGCPYRINGSFSCSQNQLSSLKYCPVYVSQNFYCYDNNKKFTEEDVIKFCDVRGNIFTDEDY